MHHENLQLEQVEADDSLFRTAEAQQPFAGASSELLLTPQNSGLSACHSAKERD